MPWGFHHFPLPGAPPGFPAWLDINLSQAGALTWLAWLRDGLLLDDSTRGLAARAVTYNPDLGIFAAATVEFDFGPGGSISARSRVSSLRMEPYAEGSRADAARLAAEVALSAAAGLMAAGQLWAVAAAARRGGLGRWAGGRARTRATDCAGLTRRRRAAANTPPLHLPAFPPFTKAPASCEA